MTTSPIVANTDNATVISTIRLPLLQARNMEGGESPLGSLKYPVLLCGLFKLSLVSICLEC